MLSPELVNLLEEHIDLGLIRTTDPGYAICDINALYYYYYRSCSSCPFHNGVCLSMRGQQYQDFVDYLQDYLQEHHPELYI